MHRRLPCLIKRRIPVLSHTGRDHRGKSARIVCISLAYVSRASITNAICVRIPEERPPITGCGGLPVVVSFCARGLSVSLMGEARRKGERVMDMAVLFEKSKDYLLEHGDHPPVLWIELARGGLQCFIFSNFPFDTTEERRQGLFEVGRTIGHQHPGDEVRQVCLIIEAWSSEDPLFCRKPSRDPKRKEALIAFVINVDGTRQFHSGYQSEIVRQKGTLTLLSYKDINVVSNNLLPAFLDGFASVSKSNRV